jgi:hypothetical protein
LRGARPVLCAASEKLTGFEMSVLLKGTKAVLCCVAATFVPTNALTHKTSHVKADVFVPEAVGLRRVFKETPSKVLLVLTDRTPVSGSYY